MGSHPLNLVFRFLLELCALGSVGVLGWTRFEGALRWVAGVGLPVLFMVLWGTFNVPHDPSRSGNAPVVVPGVVRLALELALFGAAATSLHLANWSRPAIVFGAAVALHYALSWDRVAWLLQR